MASGRLASSTHDLPPSPALQQFMTEGWDDDGPATDPGPLDVAPYAAKRRALLSARFPGERLVIPAGHAKVRNSDQHHRFRPHSAYTYLTGDQEPGGVLVLEPAGVTGHTARLLVHPRSPRSGPAEAARTQEFYRNAQLGELWVGRRRTLAESAQALQLDCADLERLSELLGDPTPTRVLRGLEPRLDPLVGAHPDDEADGELAAVLSELRLVKDDWEIAQLQAAVDHTVQAFTDVARALPDAAAHHRGERWVEGIFKLRARAEGNGCGYEPIAAAGAHACVLHWIRNDGPVRPGELLLLDAGVETDTLYTADITRTLPVSGRFSAVQRRVYDLVYAAQQAAIATVAPGVPFRAPHQAAMRVLAEGLAAWGVLPVPAAASLEPDSGLHRRYTVCASSHMLGLDVHDCAQARAAAYLEGTLEVGQVLTVEPGLYLQPDDRTLPTELRGIGVRIEDDVVVTPEGCRVLSSGLPGQADEVEAWMAGLWR